MEDNAPEDDNQETAQVFVPAFDRYNDPAHIITFGNYYAVTHLMETRAAYTYAERYGPDKQADFSPAVAAQMRRDVAWTKRINDFNKGRKWVLRVLFEKLDPMLAADIALVVVPSHDPFQDTPPIRLLAQQLAETGRRIDATTCLTRHTKIKRIVYGGPSNRALHRSTIAVADTQLVAGRSVLLLDDIVRSGASLNACKAMLYGAGARLVQAAALGRVVSSPV